MIARAPREDQVKELRRIGANVQIQPELKAASKRKDSHILDRLRNDLYT